jgi:hypothetical protein
MGILKFHLIRKEIPVTYNGNIEVSEITQVKNTC